MFGKKNNGTKVFVGLSGGVDSAVAAALLKEQGYGVTGVFIRIALAGYPCAAGEDKLEAQRVAAHLKIPFLEIDLSAQYEKEVFAEALREWAAGRTPNPDALCNQKIKFGHFWEFAKSQGADFIATGHYARITRQHPVTLLEGADRNKDQSYFLWMVPESALQHTHFPVGGMTKTEVRALAEKLCLPNATRPDSQGLCFVGDVRIEDVLARELDLAPGAVLDEAGATVGRHRGAALYTLGQRHGFQLHSTTPRMPAHFVVGKDLTTNTITVSSSRIPRRGTKTRVVLRGTNWLGPHTGEHLMARFRYRGALIPAALNREENEVVLEGAHYVPEGQSLVLYDLPRSRAGAERCAGGGIVDKAERM